MGVWIAVVGIGVALAIPAGALVPAGRPAPAWRGETIAGKTVASAQLKGKVVLLNFFGRH